MPKHRSIIWIIFSQLFGILLFLILLVILNIFPIPNLFSPQIVSFINNNATLIIVMSLIFMLGEICYGRIFPLSLPAPLFNAIGSMFLVTFIFRIFGLIDVLLKTNIFSLFNSLKYLIYPIVFLIVLIVGYVSIFTKVVNAPQEPKKRKTEDKSWDDVGDEFRNLLYDAFSNARKRINKKKRN